MAKDYTSTLNLPATGFSMRANLPQREPETLKYWDSMDLGREAYLPSARRPALFQRQHPHGHGTQ